MAGALPIIVYSDVICPWCYVGKRRLETALASPGMPAPVQLAWRPFELNPDMPPEGMERQAYRGRKFGAERSAELDRAMIETGRAAGIEFAFDRQQRTPNTQLAHRLIWEGGRQGLQDALVNRLFRAYFEDGLDIGSQDVLTELGVEVGLDPSSTASALTGNESLEAVIEMERHGRGMGIEGVPFFIVAGKYGVSGAQPPDFWQEALPKIAAETEGAASPTA